MPKRIEGHNLSNPVKIIVLNKDVFHNHKIHARFESVTPEIEDLYFATINGLNIDGSE